MLTAPKLTTSLACPKHSQKHLKNHPEMKEKIKAKNERKMRVKIEEKKKPKMRLKMMLKTRQKREG